MNGFGATGPAPSLTDLEMREAKRLAAERQARLYGRPANTSPNTIVPLHKPSNDSDEAPKKLNGHFDADVAKAYARPQTNTAAEEAAKRPNGHAHTPSSSTALVPVEVKHDTQPLKQTCEANAQGRPTALSPDFANIPGELKALPNWVMWKYMQPKTNVQKWRKVPCQPNGRTADTTDRSTWRPFDECCAAYAAGGFDGVGFVFDGKVGADGLCYVGVDFDHCIENGKLHPLVERRIKQLNTYTEVSVSGTGIHCIARAKPLDRIVKFDGVEIYTDKRYFTFTGYTHADFMLVREATAEINAIADEVKTKEAATKQRARSSARQTSKRNTVLMNPAGGADAALSTTDESLSDEIRHPVARNAVARTKRSGRRLRVKSHRAEHSASRDWRGRRK